MVVAKNPAKPRRVSMGLPLPRVRCGAKARAYPRVSICSGEATADCPVGQPATALRVALRRVASGGMLRASFCLFPFPRGDRGQISVAVDGLFAQVFPATEQEYCESDRDQCAEDGAKRPIPCPVVVAHHQLRSFGLRPTPVPDRGSCGECARAQLRQPCGAWPKHLTKLARGLPNTRYARGGRARGAPAAMR